jgi:hypothetical protein
MDRAFRTDLAAQTAFLTLFEMTVMELSQVCHFDRREKSFFNVLLRPSYPRPTSVLRPDFLRRRDHRPTSVGFDDGTFRGTVHQTKRTAGIGAALVPARATSRIAFMGVIAASCSLCLRRYTVRVAPMLFEPEFHL